MHVLQMMSKGHYSSQEISLINMVCDVPAFWGFGTVMERGSTQMKVHNLIELGIFLKEIIVTSTPNLGKIGFIKNRQNINW